MVFATKTIQILNPNHFSKYNEIKRYISKRNETKRKIKGANMNEQKEYLNHDNEKSLLEKVNATIISERNNDIIERDVWICKEGNHVGEYFVRSYNKELESESFQYCGNNIDFFVEKIYNAKIIWQDGERK